MMPWSYLVPTTWFRLAPDKAAVSTPKARKMMLGAGIFKSTRTTATPRRLGCVVLSAFALASVELPAQFMTVTAALKPSLDMMFDKSPDFLSASTTPSSSSSSSKNSRLECLSRIEDLSVFQHRNSINGFEQNLPQVFIFMAAKAGGSSLKEFVMDCSGPGYRNHHPDNFVNSEQHFKPFLLNSLQPPKIVASHIFSDKPLIDLIQNGSNKRTVILYVYRDETDRLQSAIRHVVKSRLCVPGASKFNFKKYFKNVSKSVFGIDEAPGNMLFVHYSQIDQLQRSLSEMYCPHVEPKRKNMNANKTEDKQYWVRTEAGAVVGFENWIQAKMDTLEFALKLSPGGCKHKARSIQDKLEQTKQCHFVRIHPKEWG